MSFAIVFLLLCCLSTSRSQQSYQCDFEQPCNDFLFDSYWFVGNVSSHPDHTYGNLSGHYITYKNTSTSEPLTVFRTRDWVDAIEGYTTCFTVWFYSGPGSVYFETEIAQGDDLQARLPVGRVGTNLDDPQWRSTTMIMPRISHYIPHVIFTNITSRLDLDDISVVSCPTSDPVGPEITAMSCDFDQNPCSDLLSLPHYTYTWSVVQAERANNYTSDAPIVDYSTQNETGHYIWLNNSDLVQVGAVGYLNTRVFRFTVNDGAFCLSFYYYGYGNGLENSKLSVFALAEGNTTSMEKVWPINPTNYVYPSNRWTWAFTPLPIGNYSLVFRAETSSPRSGSFALDSLVVASCKYPQRYFFGTSTMHFACDFDGSSDAWCGIVDDGTHLQPQPAIGFTVRSPSTIMDRELGPTESSGYSGPNFLYWFRSEDSPASATSGQFKTPVIETNSDICVRFSYFMNSSYAESDEPNMKLEVLAFGCANETIQTIESDNHPSWKSVVASMKNVVCTQSIYFRISQRRPSKAAVAIDDITIAPCNGLPPLTTTTSISTRQPSTTPKNRTSSNYLSSILLIAILMFSLHTLF